MLWPNGIVPFTFSNTTDLDTRVTILKALSEIEQKTCVKFTLRDDEEDYVEFTGEGDGCSSYVGRIGGAQLITLPEFNRGTCRTHGITIHEACHALGLWHEQSRPDRDQYIEIVEENVQGDRLNNFFKRNTYSVDYRGESYDYGSIMHYGPRAFSINRKPTLRVINQSEYERQGRPRLGQREGLSKSDVRQLNRMYNCPGSGVRGTLEIFVKHGFGWTEDDWETYDANYVNITAVDDRGERDTRITGFIRDFDWNQWVEFSKRAWQYTYMELPPSI